MAKKKNKKSKRRLAFFGTLSVVIIGYFIFNLCYYSYRIMVLNKSKADLEAQLTSLLNNEETLKTDIEKLKDPEYIAKYAREKYMYSMDGEYIIKIEEDEVVIDEKEDSIDYLYLIFISSVGLIIVVLYIIRKTKKQ